MTFTRPAGLASALDDLVRQVPGVATLYRATSLVAGIVAATASALRPSSGDETLILVDEVDETLAIAVTIGTEAEPAAATCRAVHDAIVDYLSELGCVGAIVKVTVGQVIE